MVFAGFVMEFTVMTPEIVRSFRASVVCSNEPNPLPWFDSGSCITERLV